MTIPVCFDERQSVVHARGVSPSSGKPRRSLTRNHGGRLVEQRHARGLGIAIAAVAPVTRIAYSCVGHVY